MIKLDIAFSLGPFEMGESAGPGLPGGLKISNVCGVFKYLGTPLSRAWGIINISGGGGAG